MNSNDMNTTTLPTGSVTMNTYLYEAVIQNSSDSFQMVITPIYFKNRISDGGDEEPALGL